MTRVGKPQEVAGQWKEQQLRGRRQAPTSERRMLNIRVAYTPHGVWQSSEGTRRWLPLLGRSSSGYLGTYAKGEVSHGYVSVRRREHVWLQMRPHWSWAMRNEGGGLSAIVHSLIPQLDTAVPLQRWEQWRLAPGSRGWVLLSWAGVHQGERQRLEAHGTLTGSQRWPLEAGCQDTPSEAFPTGWSQGCLTLEMFPGAILSSGYRPFSPLRLSHTGKPETSRDRLDGSLFSLMSHFTKCHGLGSPVP